MSALQQAPVTPSQVDQASDGAALPLLDPRLLVTLTTSPSERHTRTPSVEYLILSEADLAQFDPRRVNELRGALSGGRTVHPQGLETGPKETARARLGRVGQRWVGRGTAVVVTAALAFAVGLLASLLA